MRLVTPTVTGEEHEDDVGKAPPVVADGEVWGLFGGLAAGEAPVADAADAADAVEAAEVVAVAGAGVVAVVE